MAKGFSDRTNSSPRRVSQARLSQKTGSRHSFGGYTKVNTGNGSFSMKKTGK
jgi:hypothetical protein